METTHGRKVIRKNNRNIVFKRFVIYTVVVFVIGLLLGMLAGHIKTKITSAKNTAEVIDVTVQQYGTCDGRVYASEITLNWLADDLEFTPLDCDLDEETQEFIFYLCSAYNIDWTLVMALIECESNHQEDVISSTGDYGLMQINEINHEWLSETLGVTDYLDAEQNIRAGVFILRKLFEKYTDTDLVLMAYNMGENNASKLWDKAIYTTEYTEKILSIQQQFNSQLEGE